MDNGIQQNGVGNMAYVPLTPISNGDTIATAWGNQVKDNFAAGVPDIFTTKGDIAVASAADAAGRVGVGTNFQIVHAMSSATLGIEYSSGIYAVVTASSQSIADNTHTKITTLTATSDVYSLLDVANSRFVIPVGMPGRYYIVTAYGEYAAHATGGKYRDLQIRGAITIKQSSVQETTGTLANHISIASPPMFLSVGDTVELWTLHQAGTSLNISNIYFGLFMIR